MPEWIMLHALMTYDHLGFLPDFLSERDPRPVRGQIAENYAHGGGWQPFGKGKWRLDQPTMKLTYPGDPPMLPLAMTRLRDELIYFYEFAVLLVLQPDGSFDVIRVD